MSKFITVYTNEDKELKVRISGIESVVDTECGDSHCFEVTMKNGAIYWTTQETYNNL